MLNATVEDPLLDPSPPVFAIAGFEFDQASICRFATSEACGLVGVPEPVGRSIVSIFMDWFVAPDLGCAISLAHHADGRIFRCDVRPTLGGRIHVVLTDISNHLRDVTRAVPDGLTNLVQLGTLTASLGRMLAAMPPGVRVAVHHIDLHRIRTVNESFGHAVGDRLLIQVAERLRTLVRANGIAARLGGDAFALVQPEVTAVTQAEDLAARLVDLIGRAYVIDGQMLNVGASVGFALSAGETIDAVTLLRYAGLALHSAKNEGPGTTRIFEAHMHTRTEARRFLEKDLRLAVAMRQFRLQFQPLYNLADHRVVGFEASLDWTHPVRGAVPPQAFIPLLEEIGLIGQIDKWVLRTACREAAGWPTPASIAVNISSHQFRQSQLVETVTDALASCRASREPPRTWYYRGCVARHQPCLEEPPFLARVGRAYLTGRFRYRLLVAQLFPHVFVRQGQD